MTFAVRLISESTRHVVAELLFAIPKTKSAFLMVSKMVPGVLGTNCYSEPSQNFGNNSFSGTQSLQWPSLRNGVHVYLTFWNAETATKIGTVPKSGYYFGIRSRLKSSKLS